MKRSLNFALALLVIAALALGMFAVAEAPAEPEPIEGIEILDTDVETDETDMDEVGLALGDLVSEGPEAPATVAYRFIVGEAEYQVQQVREGAAVLPPETPAAPEGMAFEAWVLADGTPLFVDADGDGETDPVIARMDAQGEVKVWASFAQGEVQPTEEQPANEQPTEGSPEPFPATEGSDSGEGGAIALEEVVPQTEPITGEEGEGDPTSSVSPDGEPASPKGEAMGVPEEAPAEEQPAEEAPAEEASAEEQPTEEAPAEEAPAEEAPAEEQPAEEAPAEEAPAEAQPTDAAPIANALTYTGEAQALVSAGEGWLYSLDGEAFTADIPTAVDAGEYTVFFKAAEDTGAQALTVTVAKADVVLIPPEALSEGK